MSNRHTRCQAIILNESKTHVFLVKHQNIYGNVYWWFPGGRLEENETEEECIKRELNEELSIELPPIEGSFTLENILDREYKRFTSFICSGGFHNQDLIYEDNTRWKILDSEWYDMYEDRNWKEIFADPDISPFMISLRDWLLAKNTKPNSE